MYAAWIAWVSEGNWNLSDDEELAASLRRWCADRGGGFTSVRTGSVRVGAALSGCLVGASRVGSCRRRSFCGDEEVDV